MRQAISLALTTMVFMVAPRACETPTTGGTAGNDHPKGDIKVQFMDFGTFRWNTAISARKGKISCRWRVETKPKNAKDNWVPTIVDSGDYGDAKIKVAKPDKVNVWLVYNKDCGFWAEVGK
jgi:hypothetical protein